MAYHYMADARLPFGTGVAFISERCASQGVPAMTHAGHFAPEWLGRLERRYMIPRFAMWLWIW